MENIQVLNGGLKGKCQQLHRELQALRTRKDGGVDVSLEAHLNDRYNTPIEKFFAELQIDPSRMTVMQMLELDQDTRYIVPEIIRAAIRKGFARSPWYPNVISRNETVGQPSAVMPCIDLSNAEPQNLGEAETIAEGSVSYGSKTVKIQKVGIGITITDEAIRYSSVNLASIFLEDVGVRLGLKLNRNCVLALLNGDQEDGSESAAVIGVDNTSNGLVYKDEVRAHVRGSLLGRQYKTVIAAEDEINHLLNLTEHKTPYAGAVTMPLAIKTPLPNSEDVFVDPGVPENQHIFVDPAFALVQLTSQPLTIEGERIVMKQISGTVATITTGFAVVFRDGRVVVDDSKAYSSNKFPSWMDPIS